MSINACNPCSESLKPTKSSANNKPLSSKEGNDGTVLSISFIKPSIKIKNNVGDRVQPCATPW